jgi:uroporphyrinogen decarboxylase
MDADPSTPHRPERNVDDPVTGRARMLAALAGRATDRPPVWLMRQAGRTLPEYRALRKDHDFLTVMRTPELAAEVTLQPLRRFRQDAAIVFCDILIVPEAMGMELTFQPGGPKLGPALRDRAAVEALRPVEAAQAFAHLGETLRGLRRELGDQHALLGFAGAPFTLACYMVEGGGSRTFSQIKRLLYTDPDLADLLLGKLADAVADLLIFQLESGADAVQLFDTWAGELNAVDYARFAAPVNRRIIDAVQAAGGTILLFLRNGSHLLDQGLDAGANGLAMGWRMDPEVVLRAMAERRLGLAGAPYAVQGNLDPIALFGPPASIRAKVQTLHRQMQPHAAHIMNLGHGLLPDTPIAGIEAMIGAVQDL